MTPKRACHGASERPILSTPKTRAPLRVPHGASAAGPNGRAPMAAAVSHGSLTPAAR
ncbi:hypothetical protein GGH94_001056 [Coemansia aciculifera]|uniref:Uncharacterized protein n=1 Tax=Coemansia aciculifera TaxID=417176 RepID=A0A9W8M5A3_9FUNG|nr:hypothetical protein GGH94_001056 [Coemansia aciculifera]KAJ2870932.1 hypothetical protein GGH93_005207 [Coemansia aciculifera]